LLTIYFSFYESSVWYWSSEMSKSAESQGTLDISLHALVVVSIADHFTRAKVRDKQERVFGMLLGIQQGRKVEIFTSFECAVGEDGLLDKAYLEQRKDAGTYTYNSLRNPI
jgi:hypothetical protein